MSSADFTVLLPEVILSATAIAILLLIAVKRSHAAVAWCTILGFAAAFASLWLASAAAPREVTALLLIDSYSLFFSGFLIASASVVALLSFSYLENRQEHREEFYPLLVLATLGTLVLASSRHFASFFLGLEILSVSLYALVSYMREGRLSLEAGVKYLVLAATSSAFLLFGFALLYAETGSMDLGSISEVLMSRAVGDRAALEMTGIFLVLTGVGFKLAAVPFHLWTPDVYEGAPLPVTAFIASVSKGGVFAVLLRWFHSVTSHAGSPAWWAFATLAVASMLAGNLLALQQNNVKRLLAYSSIGNMGYLLLAFLSAGAFGVEAATYYLVAYVVTIVGAFGVLTVLCDSGEERCDLEDLRGLFWERPLLSGLLAAMVLSLAGIPLTAGFLGKFYIVSAAASTPLWIPILILVVSSTIGVYYYLRVLVVLFSEGGEASSAQKPKVPWEAAVGLATLTVLVFLLGVYPSPIWKLLQHISHTS